MTDERERSPDGGRAALTEDGRIVRIRPLAPEDGPALLALYANHPSPDTTAANQRHPRK